MPRRNPKHSTCLRHTIVFLTFAAMAVQLQASSGKPGSLITRLAGVSIPFIENLGQVDKRVQYYAPILSGTVFVTEEGLIYSVGGANPKEKRKNLVFTERFVDESGKIIALTAEGRNKAETKVSYFTGNDPAKRKSGSATYHSLTLGNVYPGIEVELSAHGKTVEKIFRVNPGADAAAIRLQIEGVERIKTDTEGRLLLTQGKETAMLTAPVAYQGEGKDRRYVKVEYGFLSGKSYGFALKGEYDRNQPLTIDPALDTLLSFTYLGGTDVEHGSSIILDANNNVFVTGNTHSSADYSVPGYDTSFNGGANGFIAKFNSALTSLLSFSYLAGGGGGAMAVDAAGNVFLTGNTATSVDHGVPGYDTTYNGGGGHGGAGDAFLAKFNNDLTSLLGYTYLGGSTDDTGYGVAVDAGGHVYMTGLFYSSVTFSGVPGYDPSQNSGADAYVAKFDNTLTSLLAFTYVGGSGYDEGYDIVLHSGNVFMAGHTLSTKNYGVPGYDTSYNGGNGDAYVAKLDGGLTSLLAFSYIGGTGPDGAHSLVTDADGNVFVAGGTQSSKDYGVPGFDTSCAGGPADAFVAKFSNDLTALKAFTYLGGTGDESGKTDLALSAAGDVFVAGNTTSSLTYGVPGYDLSYNGWNDVFVAQFDNTLTGLVSFTYLGGAGDDYVFSIVLDAAGNAYVAGQTASAVTYGVPGYGPSLNGESDILVAKFNNTLINPILYVRNGADGTGTSWSSAYGTLQQALDAAVPGNQIWVSAGTYGPTSDHGLGIGDRGKHLRMKNNVAVYGGFPATGNPGWDDRDWVNNATILSGDLDNDGQVSDGDAYHLFYHPAGTNLNNTAILDGFTVTGGNANGALDHECTGGGMYNDAGSPTIANCTFSGNLASSGGGVYNYNYSSPTIVNCLFSGNSVSYGGGIHNSHFSSPALINCTFGGNLASSASGAVHNLDSSNPVFNNCIFWGNSAPSGNQIHNDTDSTTALNYSCCPNGINDIVIGSGFAFSHCIITDPLFVDPRDPALAPTVAGDYRLGKCSPCIDTGASIGAPATDIEAHPRYDDTGMPNGPAAGTPPVDMGAYEHQQDSTRTITITTAPAGLSISVDGTPCTAPQTFVWMPNSNHTIATTGTQSGSGGTQYVWNNWSDAGAISHGINASSDGTYTAGFTTQYYLTTNAGPGGSVLPAGGWNNLGSVVLVTATPATGYHLVSWSGDAGGSDTVISVIMDAAKSVTAAFAVNTYTIELNSGNNGAITLNPVGNPPGTFNFGDTVTATITPRAEYHIDGVLVDGQSQGTTDTWQFADIADDHTLTVIFGPDGDLNGNQLLDVGDLVLCFRMALGIEPPDIQAADMNHNGFVELRDVILLMRKVLGKH